MDYLVDIALLVAGTLAGWFSRKLAVPQVIKLDGTPVRASLSGADLVYVRFHYKDGRVEVRKFAQRDLNTRVEWKGRVFQAAEWTPDGHVYNESDLRANRGR